MSVDETLTLISEYIIIMFDAFYVVQQQLNQFAANMPKADYVGPLLWVSMLIHREMDSFVSNGNMKHNSALASAFIRFLTKSTAQNNAAALSNRVKRLEEEWKGAGVATLAKDVKTAASKADAFQGTVHKIGEDMKRLERKLK